MKSIENLANNKWINYKFNSCHYDSFFFIYCNVIYPYIRDIGKTSYIISLDKIALQLLASKNEDKHLGFWDLIKKYNLDELGIFKKVNKPISKDYVVDVIIL